MPSRGLREAVAAGSAVALVIGLLTVWSGVWPPLVVIESGSMMHHEGCLDPRDLNRDGDLECTPYGRLGTMDVGDIVLVKKVSGRADVELLVQAGEARYGYSGDVIMFYPNNNTASTPVIHRALTWVEVKGSGPTRSYEVLWTNGEVLKFGASGIYLPEFALDERWGFPKENGFKPARSGFITRGDNPLTNPGSDQALLISPLVEPGWIVGTAHGELPWFGLTKLVFGSDFNQKRPPIYWVRVGNAYAPPDLWILLGVTLGGLLAIPVSIDVWKAWKERKENLEAERQRALRERARRSGEP